MTRESGLNEEVAGTSLERLRVTLLSLVDAFCLAPDARPDWPGVIDRADVVTPLMYRVAISLGNIIALSRADTEHFRDSYLIVRSTVETSVNCCLVLAGEKWAANARAHALQKSYRDLHRVLPGLGEIISVPPPPEVSAIPGLAEALARFSTSRGREIMGWTPESIDDRIKEIGNAFGKHPRILLATARALVYRDASEILHGTLYGALSSIGAFERTAEPGDPAGPKKAWAASTKGKRLAVIGAAGFAPLAILECLAACAASDDAKEVVAEWERELFSALGRPGWRKRKTL